MFIRLALLLIPLLCLLTGCTVPRAIGMCNRLRDSAPPPPETVETHCDLPYSVGHIAIGSGVRVAFDLQSEWANDEVLQHYRKVLADHGWTEVTADNPVGVDYANYRFVRKARLGSPVDGLPLADEEIFLWLGTRQDLLAPSAKTKISIQLAGRYLWDEPSIFAAKVICAPLYLLGEYVVVVGPIVTSPL